MAFGAKLYVPRKKKEEKEILPAQIRLGYIFQILTRQNIISNYKIINIKLYIQLHIQIYLIPTAGAMTVIGTLS